MLNSNTTIAAPDAKNPHLAEQFEHRPFIVAEMKMPANRVNDKYGIRIQHGVLSETCSKLNEFLQTARTFDKCPNVYLRHPYKTLKDRPSINYQLWAVWPTGTHQSFAPYPPEALIKNKWWLYFTLGDGEPALRFFIFLDFVQLSYYAHVEKNPKDAEKWHTVLKVARKAFQYDPYKKPFKLHGQMSIQNPNGADNKYYYTITDVRFTGISPDHLVLEDITA